MTDEEVVHELNKIGYINVTFSQDESLYLVDYEDKTGYVNRGMIVSQIKYMLENDTF